MSKNSWKILNILTAIVWTVMVVMAAFRRDIEATWLYALCGYFVLRINHYQEKEERRVEENVSRRTP